MLKNTEPAYQGTFATLFEVCPLPKEKADTLASLLEDIYGEAHGAIRVSRTLGHALHALRKIENFAIRALDQLQPYLD